MINHHPQKAFLDKYDQSVLLISEVFFLPLLKNILYFNHYQSKTYLHRKNGVGFDNACH